MSNASDGQLPRPASNEPEATKIYNPEQSATELVRILDQYLADLQAGIAPDKAQLLEKHPELAAELANCLAGIEFVHRAAKPSTGTPAQLGDFRIVREVGRGGMGVVYEAEQISLKRKVALKVLRFGVTTDADVMQRFQREAETVAHLHHTNIVPIHAVGCEQGVHYYAMQFIEGRSLADVLQEILDAPQSEERDFKQIVGWMLQGAEALAHAHQRGVIHRDIKPSNLILDPDGTVWLTDFGLAKRADEVTMTAAGVVMGTPRYMSPEQAAAARQPIDHRTDIYSLGATFYELATGKPVFDSQTPQGVITQILNAEPVAPRILQGKLPRDLETIILKCLAKEPSKRYQHARELADDLRAYLENRPIRARRASIIERSVRWAKKHSRSTAISVASAAVSIMLIAGGLVGWRAYQESMMGRLVLTTDGPSLVAEVLDENDELIVPSFPIPHPDPVKMPAGSYRVRLSGSGQFSETWQMDVARGQVSTYLVKLLNRLLAPPLELRQDETPVLIDLNGQTHLFHRGDRSWRLTRGDTLKSAWPGDLQKFPQNPQDFEHPNTAVWGAWQDVLQVENISYGQETGRTPGVTQPAMDVNGDGRDDLILASRVSPSLIAVSGSDGKVVWWYRAAPVFPPDHDATKDPIDLKGSSEEAGVIGQPIQVNINGEPAVVAVMVSLRSQARTKAGKELITLRSFYVEAVTARTGKQIWRAAFAMPEFATTYLGDVLKSFSEKAVVADFKGQKMILVHANTRVFGFDLLSGKSSWPERELGGRPIQVPQFHDLDGDGASDVLVVQSKPESQGVLATLKAVSLQTGKALWEREFRPTDNIDNDSIRSPGNELALAVDLNRDGKVEVMVPVRDDWREGRERHWFGVDVLEGATGSPRWQTKLWTSRHHFSQSGGNQGLVRFLSGPDLNGDGQSELFFTSQPPGYPGAKSQIQVDALSGQDGRVVWRQSVATSGDSHGESQSGLHWWQVGEDGWPQLLVPMDKRSREQPVTYVFAAATGRMTSLLPEVANPRVADLNGDGLPELLCLSDTQGSRRLTALKGQVPVNWRRPGLLEGGADYDGDGNIDFLQFRSQQNGPTNLDAVSGHTLRSMWHGELQRVTSDLTLLKSVDIDRDGTLDVVGFDSFQSDRGTRYTVSAISGKDGKRLWSGADLGSHVGHNSSSGGGAWSNYSYPFLDQHDLDGDGLPEILLATNIGNLNTMCLGAVSSKDGNLLWKIPFLNGAYTGSSLVDRNIWHDLNGDGTLDIVLWVPQSLNEHGVAIGSEVRAFSGRDGKPIWKTAAQLNHTWFLWPRTAIGDLDGDGAAEVVLTTNSGKGWDQAARGFPCELVVLDGKSGHRKWTWTWVSNQLDLCPPILVNIDGDGKRMVCLGVNEVLADGNPTHILIFDPLGKIRTKLSVEWVSSSTPWAALDVDDNGTEELLIRKESQLLAISGRDQRTVWKFPLTSYGCRLDELRPASQDQPATLVVWCDRSVYGLNPATGSSRWRCDVPAQDQYQLIASLGHSTKPGQLPIVVSKGAQVASTLVQHAWPTHVHGTYQPPVPAPIQFSEYKDPLRIRPLPWSFQGPPPVITLVPFLVFLATVLNWGRLGKWARIGKYLILSSLVTAGLSYWFFNFLARPLEPGEIYSWEGWYLILYIGGVVMGLLTAIAATMMFVYRQVRVLVSQSEYVRAVLLTVGIVVGGVLMVLSSWVL